MNLILSIHLNLNATFIAHLEDPITIHVYTFLGHFVGPSARWNVGTLAHWHVGTLARWHVGTLARWHVGTLARNENSMIHGNKILNVQLQSY
jgi:hypothetical protein